MAKYGSYRVTCVFYFSLKTNSNKPVVPATDKELSSYIQLLAVYAKYCTHVTR